MIWARSFGDVGNDFAYSVSFDEQGNTVIIGVFERQVEFGNTGNSILLNSVGSADVFILKLDSLGRTIWAKSISGGSYDNCRKVQIDTAGNIYLVGGFSGPMDADPGVGQHILSGSGNVFILKLNAHGDHVWSGSMGGKFGDLAGGLAIDDQGNCYISGAFQDSMDTDPGVGISLLMTKGGYDAFIIKLDSSGQLNWSKSVGGPSADAARGIAIDKNGNSYSVGDFWFTADFDPGPASRQLTSQGQSDIFILKLDSAGKHKWSKALGGASSNGSNDIQFSSSGTILSLGHYGTTIDLDPGSKADLYTALGNFDVFVQEMDTLGSYLSAFSFGGTGYDYGYSIKSQSNNLLIGGGFEDSVDFDLGSASKTLVSNGRRDAYTLIYQACLKNLDTISASACDIYSSPSGKFNWVTSGTYYDTLTNLSGCDSVIRVNLVIHHGDSVAIQASSCISYISPSGNHTWYSTGLFWDTLATINGCDSFIQVHLNIDTSSSILQISACNSYLSPSAKHIWTTSGQYKDTISNHKLCDSLITIDLSIRNNSNSRGSKKSCGSYLSPSGKTWSNTGTYVDTIQNSTNCDSIITIDLTIANPSSAFSRDTVCTAILSPSGRALWTSPGLYRDTIANTEGCDSLIEVDLLVVNIDTALTRSISRLRSNEINATYQWLDCRNAFAIIPREILSTFNPRSNGSYALELKKFSCIDTSACIQINNVGLEDLSESELYIFPNPGNGTYRLSIPSTVKFKQLSIYNSMGQSVHFELRVKETEIELKIDQVPGIYFVRVVDNSNRKFTRKFINH